MDAILKSVFYNVGKLLRSQKIITSTSERSLLKNLGSWLGKITLGRDKPVLQRELDLKELLFQARPSPHQINRCDGISLLRPWGLRREFFTKMLSQAFYSYVFAKYSMMKRSI